MEKVSQIPGQDCSATVVSSSKEGDNYTCTVQTPSSGPVFNITWNVTGTVNVSGRNSSLSTKQGSGDSFVKATLSLSGTTECQFVFHIKGKCTYKVSLKDCILNILEISVPRWFSIP